MVDEQVVVDENLITSRKPDDIPAFNRALIEALENDLGEEEDDDVDAEAGSGDD